ncbi:site-specific integrase [Enterococcus gallinarum]|nr:site-specific integrase [Enterococcus gallinarum]
MPTLLASGKYKTNLRYPERFRELTGITSEKFQKVFATKQLALKAEKDMKKKIAQVIREENANVLEIKGNMKFEDFYKEKWITRYELGQTGRTNSIPSDMTIQATRDLFRLHILPMFGNYAMNYLNANTEIISDELTSKSRNYANIRTLKSYVNSMFDVAEILGYIEFNRTTKIIQSITSPKKIALQEKREQEGKQSLTANELIEWLEALQSSLSNKSLSFKDYTLFLLTLYLGDRKSESYALQWKHIDFEAHTIRLKFSLNKKQKQKKLKVAKIQLFKCLKLWNHYSKNGKIYKEWI